MEPGLLDLKALQFPFTRCTVFCVGVGRVQVGECEREAEETERKSGRTRAKSGTMKQGQESRVLPCWLQPDPGSQEVCHWCEQKQKEHRLESLQISTQLPSE